MTVQNFPGAPLLRAAQYARARHAPSKPACRPSLPCPPAISSIPGPHPLQNAIGLTGKHVPAPQHPAKRAAAHKTPGLRPNTRKHTQTLVNARKRSQCARPSHFPTCRLPLHASSCRHASLPPSRPGSGPTCCPIAMPPDSRLEIAFCLAIEPAPPVLKSRIPQNPASNNVQPRISAAPLRETQMRFAFFSNSGRI